MKQMFKPRIHFGVIATFLVSGAVPLAGSALVHIYFSESHGIHEPLHSVIEAAGAFIAITLAVLLLQMRAGQDMVHFTWIASALISMGVLDGFHSGLDPGAAFVWTHSLATLIGGLLFCLIWLPDYPGRTRLAKALPGSAAVIATLVGILIATFPNELPAALYQDGFTLAAKAINLSGGLCFIAAGICFLLRYHAQSRKDDLLFANQCLLFGGAGVIFPNSSLWDAAWWYWHLLRLVGYLVVFGYAFSVYRRLRDELHDSEARSRAMVSAMPDLMVRFHRDGTLRDFHLPDDSLHEKLASQIVVGANIHDSQMRREAVDQIMAASRKAVGTSEAQTIEFAYPKESELRHYEARIVASGNDELVATVRNITERKQMEETLRQREREFRFLAGNVPGLFSYVDSDQRYRFVNKSYENAHNLPQDQIIGRCVREVLGEAGYALARKHIETALSGQPVTYEAAFSLRGGTRWMSVVYLPDLDELGMVKGFFTLITDITERKQVEEALRLSQEELRALAGQLFSAREEEARRIARELHDEFGQRLAALNLKASEIASLLSSQPQLASENLQAMSREIGSVAKAIHDLSRRLHPAVLSQLGLELALESECTRYSQQHGALVEFQSGNIPEILPDDTALCLYRVVQAALQNISKHAHANRAMVAVETSDGEIVLTVQDFGRGFDLDAVRGEGGLGLVSMEERVRMVGGTISVHSQLGQGTQIEVHVPIGRS